jgi:hypothetical protein
LKKSHFRSFAILIGLLVCAGACYGILRLWEQPADAYWTPAAYAPPLAQASDRVEVFVGGEPILKLAADQKLVLKEKTTEAPLAPDQLVARVNNYDRVRLARIPTLLALAAAAGAGLVFFLVGVFAPMIAALHPQELVDLHLET